MTEQRHESKTKLLNAALHVIRAKGYTATRIEDICAEAGVTKGSFFHHFKSKEDLALAAIEHFGNMAGTLFSHAPFTALQDPLQRLLGYIDFRKSILQGDLPEFTCLLGTMVQEVYETHPVIRQACEAQISKHALTIAQDIAQAKAIYLTAYAEADTQNSWTPESLAFFTQAVLQGAFILAKARHDPNIAADCINHLKSYVEFLFPQPKENSL